MDARNKRQGFTLVELLVVIAIIGVLVALLLPAVQAAREAARRNSCLNNIKQIGLALHNHDLSLGGLPFASTGFFDPAANVGSEQDGYSWLFQLLPYMEQTNLYEQVKNATLPTGTLGGGSANLRQGPFVPLVELNTTGTNNLAINQQVEALICPSFPGAETTKGTDYAGQRAAIGNYVTLAATHYNVDGQTTAQQGPTDNLYESSGNKAGNGAIFFAQRPNGVTQDVGGNNLISVKQKPASGSKARPGNIGRIRDGTSSTIWFTESREERYGSWISGLSMYVVGADPRGPGSQIEKSAPTANATNLVLRWGDNDTLGQTALNVGLAVKRAGGENADDPSPGAVTDPTTEAYFYDHQFPHGSQKRWYGPSSAHPASVLHGFADGHGKTINDTADRDVYLHLITINGREVVSEGSGGGFSN